VVGVTDTQRLGTDRLAAGRRLPALLASRVAEQAVLGGAAILLAARLGTEGFAPVAVLLVVASAAVALADYGVGLAVLRRAPGEMIAGRARRRMRIANAVILGTAVVIGIAFGDTTGEVIALGGAVWATTAEAFIAKAAAINAGSGHRAAAAELVAIAAFAAAVVGFADGAAAIAVVGGALVVKQLLEVLLTRPPDVFAPDGTQPELVALWGTQASAFAVANVDYLLVGIMLGPAAFSIYTIGYRVAVALPSVLAYVATRTAIADLGATTTADEREARLARYVRPLFALGVLGALIAAAAAFVLPLILGSEWDDVRPTVLVLAIAVPWRMIFGQAGALALVARRSHELVVWQLLQLGAFAVALAIAASIGYGVFVGVVAGAWIVSVVVVERAATRAAGVAGWRALVPASVVGVIVVACVSAVAFV
jgi:O-antigen/teichoic acid export membrane protein